MFEDSHDETYEIDKLKMASGDTLERVHKDTELYAASVQKK